MEKCKKNHIVSLEITGMTAEGAGVGHHEGMAIFVPGTAPGDHINCKIVKVLKSYAFGIVDELLVPSGDRAESDCPVFTKCGGCVYRHISREAEIRIKTARIRDAIERIGGINTCDFAAPIAAETRCGYRNKAQIPLGADKDGKLTMGYYGTHSHRIVPMDRCMLHPAVFDTAMNVFRQWHSEYGDTIYDENTHKGVLRHLYLRWGEKTGELMVCVVMNGKILTNADKLVAMLKESLPGLTSVVLNTNKEKTNVILGKTCRTIYGKDEISDILCGLTFTLSPLAFYQVNRTQAERLYEKAAEYAALTGKERLMDLYCGAGTIGLSMAKSAKSLIGVEIIPEAIENAKENAKRNGIENAEFICADAEKAAKMLMQRGETPDVIVVDPPRKGLTPALIVTMAELAPQKIVYISCDPATLARDLKQFSELGYPPTQLTPCDLFPATAHVESVVLLSSLNKSRLG